MGPPGRSSTSCRASRADGGPAGAGFGPGGPGPAGGRPMPGWRIRMEDRKCGHHAPLQSTKARYQVLRRRPSRSRRAPPTPRRSRRCDSYANRCRPRVRRRRCDHAPSGYPHRRWNCLRRCSRPPTSVWRDGSASSWRCPLAPSGSTGAPAGADPPDPPPPARQRTHRQQAARCGPRRDDGSPCLLHGLSRESRGGPGDRVRPPAG